MTYTHHQRLTHSRRCSPLPRCHRSTYTAQAHLYLNHINTCISKPHDTNVYIKWIINIWTQPSASSAHNRWKASSHSTHCIKARHAQSHTLAHPHIYIITICSSPSICLLNKATHGEADCGGEHLSSERFYYIGEEKWNSSIICDIMWPEHTALWASGGAAPTVRPRPHRPPVVPFAILYMRACWKVYYNILKPHWHVGQQGIWMDLAQHATIKPAARISAPRQ